MHNPAFSPLQSIVCLPVLQVLIKINCLFGIVLNFALTFMLLFAAGSQTLAQEVTGPRQFQFKDLAFAEYFVVSKSLNQTVFSGHAYQQESQTPAPITQAPQRLVFVIAGSGCQSFGPILPDYFLGLEGELGDVKIHILQKRHISFSSDKQASLNHPASCSDAFVRDDYPSRWLSDQREFIQAMLSHKTGSKPKVLLLGISEGAEVASQLAAELPEITHLAMLGNGGMAPMDGLQILVDKHPELRTEWKRIKKFRQTELPSQALEGADTKDAQTLVKLNGRSERYWQELAQSNHSNALLSLTIPVFIGMGESDQSVPLESALWLQEQFQKLNKPNLYLKIFPQADHGLHSQQQFYLPDFMHQLDLWF